MSHERGNAYVWTERETAEKLGVHHQTLRHWRLRGEGPVYWRTPGRLGRVRYSRDDVADWIVARRRTQANGAGVQGDVGAR